MFKRLSTHPRSFGDHFQFHMCTSWFGNQTTPLAWGLGDGNGSRPYDERPKVKPVEETTVETTTPLVLDRVIVSKRSGSLC